MARKSLRIRPIAYLFIAPNFVLFFGFVLYPLLFSLYASFNQWNILNPMRFVDLANFAHLLSDPRFWNALRNTLYFVLVAVPLRTLVGLLVALLIYHVRRMGYLFRVLYFFPYVSMLVAVALVFMWLYDPNYGLFNYLLSIVGIHGPGWLQSPTWAMPSIIILSVWKNFGYVMVIYLASIIALPTEFFEAAELDGATRLRQIWHIMLPLVSPTTFFVVVIQLINSFQVFPEVYIMTQGGPADATQTIVYGIYEIGFSWFQMGYASSWAWAMFIIILAFVTLQWRMRTRWVFSYV